MFKVLEFTPLGYYSIPQWGTLVSHYTSSSYFSTTCVTGFIHTDDDG